jgi:hypothetical protein
MPRRLTLLAVALVALLVAAVPALSATGKSKRATGPVVKSFSPTKPEIGGKLTLFGKGFARKPARNTVVLRAPTGGSTFVKPRTAAKGKLVLRIPATLERLMRKRAGATVATRFRVRVLSGRKFGPWTPKRRSPVIQPSGAGSGPADCDGDELPNETDPNDDNDLLEDSLESSIKTDVCVPDTDNDGIEDGWEYWAAKDLNLKAAPYPGKRPFPNALDPSDAHIDFDGDSLTASEEHLAWNHSGSGFDESLAGGHNPFSPLSYSDGTQRSRENPADITVPQWRGGQYGVPVPGEPFPALLDWNSDGVYQDDERDLDADGLINYIETHGPGSSDWWTATLKKENVEPYPMTYWGAFSERPFLNLWGSAPVADPTGLVNPDADGDSLLDGEDDQDNDDVSNVLEMYFRTVVDSETGDEFNTNAFNPCAPDQDSRTCDRHPPIE